MYVSKFEDYSSLIYFVKNYKHDFKISKSSISNLKNRNNLVKSVPRTIETMAFIEYVKMKFPEFDSEAFFK